MEMSGQLHVPAALPSCVLHGVVSSRLAPCDVVVMGYEHLAYLFKFVVCCRFPLVAFICYLQTQKRYIKALPVSRFRLLQSRYKKLGLYLTAVLFVFIALCPPRLKKQSGQSPQRLLSNNVTFMGFSVTWRGGGCSVCNGICPGEWSRGSSD